MPPFSKNLKLNHKVETCYLLHLQSSKSLTGRNLKVEIMHGKDESKVYKLSYLVLNLCKYT